MPNLRLAADADILPYGLYSTLSRSRR
ncbi:hypothetical protein BCEN4_40070 [Burkholderia cenocepacia]|nr:hypothetical protein BCEN4_40070 [Burkholderia cenocepacia]